MPTEITPASHPADGEPQGGSAEKPRGRAAEDRGSLGTLSWPRAAKIAGLAAAVAALAALSIAAGHMVRVVGPPQRTHTVSTVAPQRAPGNAP